MPPLLRVPKLIKQSIGSQAEDVLRESIINGDIPAGSRITEIQLAEQMDLSRATVRAALHQLAKEGLTSLIPYTGWTVISLTPQDVWELYTLRSCLERLAAQLVASTLDEMKRKQIERCYAVLVEHCTLAVKRRVADADFAFHKTIIDLSGNGRLKTQYGIIERQIRVYIRSSDSLVENDQAIIEQHRPIVDAILNRDPIEAGRLSEVHNLTEGRKLTQHLQTSDVPEIGPKPISETGRLRNLNARRTKGA
ncbi:TPA: GntR family transcriptional regulator [Burkholderia vietnamiensis]|nr:GntR family transcriptional regulator [Burkholderia vietnamiensis]